jgi:predicted nucleic acid-binding protein
MTVVVDASVALRWLLDLPGSEKAFATIQENDRIIAPDLVLAEIANGLWKAAMFAGLSHSDAKAALAETDKAFDEFVPANDLKSNALLIALELRHPAYDCFYIALAEARRCKLITADTRLVRRCAKTKWAEMLVAL